LHPFADHKPKNPAVLSRVQAPELPGHLLYHIVISRMTVAIYRPSPSGSPDPAHRRITTASTAKYPQQFQRNTNSLQRVHISHKLQHLSLTLSRLFSCKCGLLALPLQQVPYYQQHRDSCAKRWGVFRMERFAASFLGRIRTYALCWMRTERSLHKKSQYRQPAPAPSAPPPAPPLRLTCCHTRTNMTAQQVLLSPKDFYPHATLTDEWRTRDRKQI
jgi:hypothetical protein